MKVLWNEEIVDETEVQIDLEDRGYQFGDGLYEVIRIYDGQFFMEKEHLDRLWACADKIRLTLPFERAEFSHRLHRFAEEVGIKEGRLYFQVTRGVCKPRLHDFPDPKEVKAVLTADIQPASRPLVKQKNGIHCGFVADKRWLHCDIKSISLLGNIMALDEAKQKGFEDAVLERDGIVTEASASNLWMVKNQKLFTHPDGELVLPGITKIKLREIAQALNIELIEEPFTTTELLQADECFKTSSVAEIMPIVSIDHQKIGTGEVGTITNRLLKAYSEVIKMTVQENKSEI
ncbi:D-amino-acid transaminase [Enterococcus alishanensis]|uniref:D-amino-acid transaminase n=1 Tax=Enterococcus alishanensis TaxID=1303817 RepID=A0ABS6TFA1_9ENTE|nr:D-amino-acid transaminase [Enterococcus alishanensis]MBV7391585.1 D-amino-acid transaminase [Enterococcus alishanensis]